MSNRAWPIDTCAPPTVGSISPIHVAGQPTAMFTPKSFVMIRKYGNAPLQLVPSTVVSVIFSFSASRYHS